MTHASTRHAHRTTDRPVELLAPAGGPEPFAAALAAGADAIYCGMGAFNARRKAENFTDETFAAACRGAHLAGARVYVTVNIVIKDHEMAEALETVRRCAALGADAFIIQDWGLFFEVRRLMPELELHVSTQANVHDARGAAWCRDAGADRVTLSRELSLPEIAEIAPVGVDLEVFAHGSICFSYSGLCTLSSFACQGRSANRGMCAQPCRLPYELIDETGAVVSAPGRERALCPRDNCTVDILPDLIAAGAASLKLEGRMKAPDYVYAVTDAYRTQLDRVLAAQEGGDNKDLAASDEVHRQLKRCFNRDFTNAYFTGTSGDEMMSYERSNNRGQVVGTVAGFTADVRTRRDGKRVPVVRRDGRGPTGTAWLQLDEPVGAGDLLELRDDADPDQFLTALAREDAPAGERIGVSVPRPMPTGALVRLIRSQAALDAADAVSKRAYPRKRAVHVRVTARLGKAFTVEIACADNEKLRASASGFTVEAARTRAVTAEDLVEHVGRMGSSPFEPVSFDVELDEGCGMGFAAVHKVRAAACEALEARIVRPYGQRAERLRALPPFAKAARTAHTDQNAPHKAADASDAVICALVTGADTLDAARDAGAARIYAPVDALCALAGVPVGASGTALAEDQLARALSWADQHEIVPVLDEVCRRVDRDRLDPWVRGGKSVAVSCISELALAEERGAATEVLPSLPVHNVACARVLTDRGAQAIWLSPEIALDEIERLAPHVGPAAVGITAYGRPRVMTSEHCILMAAGACIHDCARCALRRRDLALRNIDNHALPVRTDLHGRSRLYDAFALDLTPHIDRLLAAGVSRFMVEATLLSPDETRSAVGRTRRAIAAAAVGRRPEPRAKGTSAGCLFTGVE